MTGSWPLNRPCRIDSDTAVGPLPAGWCEITSVPLVVLVGLTGAGKTTLAKKLVKEGQVALLPDRRRLTDEVILGENADVLDRSERFAATARFRDEAPGGMGEVLAALSVASPSTLPRLFDGLRGAAEIEFFAPRAPRAVFLPVKVSDGVRAQRIAERGQKFDGGASGSFAKARALVADEATHYSLQASLDALAKHAPGRVFTLDAEKLSPDEVAVEASAIIEAIRH